MALADDRGVADAFEKQPPQEIAAEQSVLGGMLLSKDAIADVVDVLSPQDFYRPAHQAVYDCILDLYGRGEPADPITVSAELERRGELLRVGGAPYLHTLIATVPTAANAGYYAEIVSEKAVLRRLVEAGTRIVQLGYHGAEGAEIDEIVDRAQASIYDVTARRTSEDYVSLEDLLQPTMDEIDAIASRGGAALGVPTGFVDLDAVSNGLHAGQMIIVAARPGVGKALALDTPLPTPDGWTTMGEVRVGEQLIGADGRPTTVVAATEVMVGRPCYRVEFSDGTVIVADAAHQWLTETRAARRAAGQAAADHPGCPRQPTSAEVRTTRQIAETLHSLPVRQRGRTADGRWNHSVGNARALDLPHRPLPLSPYVLGVWLGDGHAGSARFTTDDQELVCHVEAEGYHVMPHGDRRYGIRCHDREGTVAGILRTLGVLGNKRVPGSYLRASADQRRALLAGLLDAEGTVTTGGSVRLPVTNQRLADDVRELVVGLSYHCSVTTGRVRGRTEASSTAYAITFDTDDDVFRLERKRLWHKERRRAAGPAGTGSRLITDVRPVPSVPVRCVQVDNSEHLYLASRSMIPTHNSTLGLDFVRSCSVKHGMTSVIFSLEMSRTEIVMRLLSAEAKIRLQDMRGGRMTDDDWTRLARRMSEISEAPLFIDDSPNMTMMEIRAKARRLKQRNDLALIVVDYLQLMTSGKRVESRQQEVSEFSRNLKLLAKELEVPVVAISQLNRGPEQRTDKRPMLADLRESGCLTANTRLLRADTGAEVSFGELMRTGERPIVWSLDGRMRLVPRPVTNVFSSGVKEVFRVRLASGREIEATANHPMLTVDGWVPLGELAVGARVAVPRQVPEPLGTTPLPEAEVVLLAHLIGGGRMVRRQSIRYASGDEANLCAVGEAAKHFGVSAVRDEHADAGVRTLRLPTPDRFPPDSRNPVAAWLDELGVLGRRSHERFLPDRVFSLPRDQIVLFLRHLWATDGSVRWDDKAGQARLHYPTTSRRLADDLARLLLRIGVFARIKPISTTGHRDAHHVLISGAENQLVFLDQAGCHGGKSIKAAAVAARLRTIVGSTHLDTVPQQVWERVRALLAGRSMTHRDHSGRMNTQFRGSTAGKHAPSRTRLARAAAVLDDAELEMLATNDVFWDDIAEITSLGEQPVFDATVPGTHNFVANCIAMHNSLEQDADMVLLVHRPDAWERDDPRAGEADLILAKHRAGPTTTITVAHQLHYSRFVDLAQG